MKELVAHTRVDHRPHTLLHSYAGAWGHPTLFLGTRPKGTDLRAATAALGRYVLAKKHQVASDRALALLIDESMAITASWYLNTTPRPDELFSELAADMQLRSPQLASRFIPPSARRATHRLRGRKGKGN